MFCNESNCADDLKNIQTQFFHSPENISYHRKKKKSRLTFISEQANIKSVNIMDH